MPFSYPRRAPFGSTSLVYDEGSDLIDLDRDELLEALTAIRRLKKRFPVFNPTASLDEVARFVRGEKQAIPCIGGASCKTLAAAMAFWLAQTRDKGIDSQLAIHGCPCWVRPEDRAPFGEFSCKRRPGC